MAQPNFANRTLFMGDNIDFLRGMNGETVDLIATDPPFNKSRDFHATPGSLAQGAKFQDRWSWERDVQEPWTDEIKDEHPQVHALIDYVIGGIDNDAKTRRNRGGREDMAAFLAFMAVRILHMRRILKPTGSIYLHCDPTASHYLKALMDAVFGARNFRNEIVWAYTGPGSPGMRQFNRKHDIIFWYAKGKSWTFNSDEVRVPHKSLSTNRVGRVIADALTPEVREEYLKRGKVPESWWSNFSPVGRIKSERVGYPTQKPLALYERIIKASSNEGDMVVDPFCGCATTPIAAERLERQWVGMDLWDGAYEIVKRRMEDNRQMLAQPNPQIIYTEQPPVRTDDRSRDPADFDLDLVEQIPKLRWQKLTHKEMRAELEKAQANSWSGGKLIDCGGCGRSLESAFMELDHMEPRSDGGENYITNRILLCRPCNGRKSNTLTMSGLRQANKRENWMKDESVAIAAQERARRRARQISIEMSGY